MLSSVIIYYLVITFIITFVYIFSTFVTPMLAAVGIILLEGKKLKPMWKAILMYPIFMGSWIVINIKSLIFPNKKWDKIAHIQSVSIDEINK